MKKFNILILSNLISTCMTGAVFAGITPAEFIQKVYLDNKMVVETANVAVERAADEKIKNIAQQFCADYKAENERLIEISKQANLNTALDQDLNREQRAVLRELKRMKGEEFDGEFIAAQQEIHEEKIDFLENYAETGNVAPFFEADMKTGGEALQEFSKVTLPVLNERLEALDEIETQQ